LSPWIAKFEAEADRKLCGPGYYTKFDERALLRTDMAARQQYYQAMRQWGAYTANDVLRSEGEQPGGPELDVYLSPVNMQNAKAIVNQTESMPHNPTAGGQPGENP